MQKVTSTRGVKAMSLARHSDNHGLHKRLTINIESSLSMDKNSLIHKYKRRFPMLD